MAATNISMELIHKCIDFHGHWCPGLATGIRAAEYALNEFGHSSDEELVTVAETDFCGVDAIQFLTGCTLGKGNLIVRELGKVAFSFYRRSDGKARRIVLRPADDTDRDEYRQLQEKSNDGSMSEEEWNRFMELRDVQSGMILGEDLEDLFEVKEVQNPAPAYAPMKKNVICSECGEQVMETKARLSGGRVLCIPCFEKLNPRY